MVESKTDVLRELRVEYEASIHVKISKDLGSCPEACGFISVFGLREVAG